MDEKIALELNSLELLKYSLYKDYHLPKELSNINLTQERILMTVKNSVNSSMVGIARAIGLEKGPFSQTVDKLEGLGLLKRIRAVDDRRQIFLELTTEGKKLTQKIEINMDAHFKERTKHLSVEEHHQLIEALNTLKNIATILISKS